MFFCFIRHCVKIILDNKMKKSAKNLDFIEAAQYRDLIVQLENKLKATSTD